jgi:mRNA-degrading endonuclease RelE of RelBE toxin-antitoxin system
MKWCAKAVPKSENLSELEEGPKRSILIPYRVWEDLDSYDKNLKSKFIRAFRFLSRDINHPSLRVEVIKEGGGARSYFRIRVGPQYRIHFELQANFYSILAVGPHRLEGIG